MNAMEQFEDINKRLCNLDNKNLEKLINSINKGISNVSVTTVKGNEVYNFYNVKNKTLKERNDKYDKT